ncbi:MAG: D-alanine--D-alanine ligase [Rhodothermales bacterium]|nr:D-alanine--D-alanine ligase [Rhodothermales bacterium]
MPPSERSIRPTAQSIGFFFGGSSPEHEVSVITGLQAAAALDDERVRKIAVYVTKDGRWMTGEHLLEIENYRDLDSLVEKATEVGVRPGPGQSLLLDPVGGGWFSGRPDPLRVDLAFLAFHGGAGENGSVQGLCETMGVPYTGSGVAASAMGMDKPTAKAICREAGVPVTDATVIREDDWAGSEDEILDQCERRPGFPAVVKPTSLGSSIGISRVENRVELEAAVEEALRYDWAVLVEECVPNLREINCSVLGDRSSHRISALEEPIAGAGLLSFDDKYRRSSDGGGKFGHGAKRSGMEGMASLDRIIPAPLDDEIEERIRTYGSRIFTALDCSGVVRIDFLLNDATGEVYFNEINTIPGSLSFYLWDPVGVSFPELVSMLVEIALQRHEQRNRRVRSYDVNLLEERSIRGLKGSKG